MVMNPNRGKGLLFIPTPWRGLENGLPQYTCENIARRGKKKSKDLLRETGKASRLALTIISTEWSTGGKSRKEKKHENRRKTDTERERGKQRGKEDRDKHTSGRAGTSASWPRTSDSRNSANKTSFSPSSSPSSSSLRPFRQPESAGDTKTEGRNSIAIARKPSLREAKLATGRRHGWWRNLLEWRNYTKWKETRSNDRRNYKGEVAKGGSEELKEIERDGNWRTSPSLFKQPQFSHPSFRCKNGNTRWMVSSHSSISNAFVCKLFEGGYIHVYPLTAQRMINCCPLWPLPITIDLLTTSWMTSFHLEGWLMSKLILDSLQERSGFYPERFYCQ